MHPRLTHRGPWLDHAEEELPVLHGTLIRIKVERLPGDRDPKPVAVVLGHHSHRHGRGLVVAVLPPPIRPGAHLPADEADPRLDRPEDPPRRHRRHRRSVDLADHRRPHPDPPRPLPGRRRTPALGATGDRTPPSHSRPRPPGVSQHPRDSGPSGSRTETVPAGPGTATRREEQATSPTPQRRQDGQTSRLDQGTSRPTRTNAELRGRQAMRPVADRRNPGEGGSGVRAWSGGRPPGR